MKRVIISAADPDNNPKDAAEAILQSLGSSITRLHNLHLKYKKIYNENVDNDTKMNEICDKAGAILTHIDQLFEDAE